MRSESQILGYIDEMAPPVRFEEVIARKPSSPATRTLRNVAVVAAVIATLFGLVWLRSLAPSVPVVTEPVTQFGNGMIAYGYLGGDRFEVHVVDTSEGSPREAWTTSGQCPVFSADGTMIAYRTEEGLDVFQLAADGTRGEPLNVSGAAGRCASFSPDGQQLATVIDDPSTLSSDFSEGELSVIPLDTGEPRSLGLRLSTAYGSYSSYPRVTWAPGGDQLLVEENGNIWLVELDGSEPPRLLAGAIAPAFGPSFSPDGSMLAFSRYDRPFESASQQDIWVAEWPLHDERNLTDSPEWESEPAWSPDGRFIAFVRQECETCPGEVVISDLNGEMRVLESPDVPLADDLTFAGTSVEIDVDSFDDGWQIRDLVWSPDGTRLAYRVVRDVVVEVPEEVPVNLAGLITVAVDSGEPVVVVPAGFTGFADGISWQVVDD